MMYESDVDIVDVDEMASIVGEMKHKALPPTVPMH